MPSIKRWGWICVLAAVLQFTLPSLLFTEEDEPYDVFLVQTHHKTGTALAGEPWRVVQWMEPELVTQAYRWDGHPVQHSNRCI
jgi:hypothetical protein